MDGLMFGNAKRKLLLLEISEKMTIDRAKNFWAF